MHTQRLGETFETPHRSTRWERNRYRAGGVFVDPTAVATPMDRNQRAKLLYTAEQLERRSKAPGKRNGLLGQSGLQVLRALLLRFANSRTGSCFPSLLKIQAATRLCRQTIVAALARLERCGIIRIVRRLIRTMIERVSPITGELQRYVGVVQTSNAYSFNVESSSSWAADVEMVGPGANARPFPQRRQRSLLEQLIANAAGSTQQSETHNLSFNK